MNSKLAVMNQDIQDSLWDAFGFSPSLDYLRSERFLKERFDAEY